MESEDGRDEEGLGRSSAGLELGGLGEVDHGEDHGRNCKIST